MNTDKYTVGSQLESWNGSTAQSLTFIVTEDCNLRCKYCYITHKASNKKMNFSVAKKFIDYVLNSEMIKQHAVTLDFIGGEPLLEIELIDKICDYFKLKTYEMGISWYWNYRISICTNGVNYLDKRIQKFISKNKSKLSMTITIDGTKAKHDLQRVFPDGTGSYDVVKKNVDVWKNQFYASTKVTFASADLKYLKDSIIELWQEGIPEIAANVVFEDVWKEDDDKIFEEQLRELADYILENHLFDKYQCSLFDDSIGQPYTEDEPIEDVSLSDKNKVGTIENIKFESVTFGYQDALVLKGLNLTLNGAGMYAVVGKNGCGKSTLLKLLLRLYRQSAGNIFINGNNIKNFNLANLRQQISYIPKNSFLLNETVRFNITLGRKIDDKSLAEICRKVDLVDFIESLPHKYEEIIGENGCILSSGTKQKFAIARAMLQNTTLWLCDEITSDLDGDVEKKIVEILQKLAKDKIIIIISHKLSTIDKSNMIFLMHDGCIEEAGTNKEMIGRSCLYRQMFEESLNIS